MRVYVNIGMCSDYWTTLHDPINGTSMEQKPFRIDLARKDCADWRATESRMAGAEAFLKTMKPVRLKDFPEGAKYLSTDSAMLGRGALVFADRCASCHSSKQPPEGVIGDAARDWFRAEVQRLVKAGELDPAQADERFERLVRLSAPLRKSGP